MRDWEQATKKLSTAMTLKRNMKADSRKHEHILIQYNQSQLPLTSFVRAPREGTCPEFVQD